MNTKVRGPEDYEEQGFKLPKSRNLLPSKKYRESVLRWGEPSELKRRRVIIVPSIECPARDISTTTAGKGKKLQADSESDGFATKVESYRKRLEERKKIRGILNNCGLRQDWLTNKSGRTELESRVLKRMQLKGRPEITIKEAPTPPPAIEEDTSITGEDRGVPTIHHPSPAALAVIQEYLEHKRLRLLDLFAQADKDKNWAVSRQEFRNIIRSWKIPLTEADLEDLIIALDRDNSDALDYRELAVGRQSYLEERVTKQTAEFVQNPTTKSSKRPETIPEEPEPSQDPSQEKGTQRPGSPQMPPLPQRPPSAPKSPSPRRPSTSPLRPHSPSSGMMAPAAAAFVGHRPDSEPQIKGARPVSPTGTHSSGSMSPTLLEIPAFQLSEKVEQLTEDEIKKRRSKKQQKRKEKEKKQRKRVAPEKATVAPSTMGGRLGEMVDRYRRMTMKEYNDVVEMCQMHGVPVSKAVLGKVLLHPEDKPLSKIKLTARRPGLFSITARHHIPATKLQSSTVVSNPRRPKFRDPGPSS